MDLSESQSIRTRYCDLRKRVHEILEVGHPGDLSSRVVDYLLIVTILISVAAIVLESVPVLSSKYQGIFEWIQLMSTMIFAIEYGLRVWSIVESKRVEYRAQISGRVRFIFSPLALIDLIAIAPTLVSMLINMDLRFLRVVRLLRLLKLARYSPAIGVLWNVISQERQAIKASISILLLVLIFASSGIFIFENAAQPEAFSSIPAAMWWAVATVTTVGYGDITPITAGGKLFGSCISFIGVGMVAIPTGILASGFSDELRKRRESYIDLVDEVLVDGLVTPDERRVMEMTRQKIGISEQDAALIFRQVLRETKRFAPCPQCGHNSHTPIHDRQPDKESLC